MIETYDNFATLGKGPNLTKVATALKQYWLGKNGRNLHNEVVQLKLLIDACTKWLKLKDSKSEYKKNMFGETSYFNTKFLDRKQRIAKLAEDATRELLTLLGKNGMLTHNSRGEYSFNIRKFNQQGKRINARHTTKSLASGYEQERESWLKSKKTSAVSGSTIHGLVQKGGNPSPQGGKLSGSQASAWKHIVKGTGTAKEWKILSEIDKIEDLRVAYLKKAQRMEYLVYIDNGKFVDYKDIVVDTTALNIAEQALWAMDRYGNMFVYDDWALGKQLKIRQVNHSSMNAGKEIICAGMIKIEKGAVTVLTNTSGHYKPTRENFAVSMGLLKDEGLDLRKTEIMAVRPHPTPKKMWWMTFDADTFISTGGMCKPLQEVMGPEP